MNNWTFGLSVCQSFLKGLKVYFHASIGALISIPVFAVYLTYVVLNKDQFFLPGQRNLPSSLKHAHILASWVAGAIGLPNLLAQFYMYTFDKVVSNLF